jgi:hypothetical protein
MAGTGRLGNNSSLWGNILLGADTAENPLEQSITSSISFVSNAVANNISAAASSAISFVSIAAAVTVHEQALSSILDFVQQLFAEYGEEIEDSIAFVSSADGVKEVTKSITSTLALDQDYHQSLIAAEASNTLELTDSLNVAGPVYVGLGSTINLTQTAIGNYPQRRNEGHFIPFNQVAGIHKTASAASTLSFTQSAFRQFSEKSTLTFTQAVIHAKGAPNVFHNLGIGHQASPSLLLNLTPGHTVGFKSSVTFWIGRPCLEKSYSPFIGSGSPGAPPTTPPTLGAATLTLTYPYIAPTTTLVLRNPEFQNKESLNFNRINRETRGGTLVVYADPDWPKAKVLTLTLRHLKQAQVDALLTFLQESLGKEVGLLDHENRQWRGIILNPDAEIAHVSREDRTVELQFEGELI